MMIIKNTYNRRKQIVFSCQKREEVESIHSIQNVTLTKQEEISIGNIVSIRRKEQLGQLFRNVTISIHRRTSTGHGMIISMDLVTYRKIFGSEMISFKSKFCLFLLYKNSMCVFSVYRMREQIDAKSRFCVTNRAGGFS